MDSFFGIFKQNNQKKSEELYRHSVAANKSTKKSKGLPMNPNSIFSYDQSNPFESPDEENKSRQQSPRMGRKSTGGIFHNSGGKDRRKNETIVPKQLDGTITLNEKQIANFQDRLKMQQEKNEESDREAILREIAESQMKKRSIKIHNIINSQEYIDIEQLRAACWNGIPQTIPGHRCDSWKILLDYMPIDADFRNQTLERKRQEYFQIAQNYFINFEPQSVKDLFESSTLSDFEKKNLKQIKIDVLRTQPDISLFKCEQMQCMMTRILFIWAIRHPASAYVQGINDLCAPLLLVFLSEYVLKSDDTMHLLQQQNKREISFNRCIKNSALQKEDLVKKEIDIFSVQRRAALLKAKNRNGIYDIREEDFKRAAKVISRNHSHRSKSNSSQELEDLDEFFEEIGDIDPVKLVEINQEFQNDLLKAEADVFWCLSKIIDDIQDNYTEMQPGVHKIINKMKALIQQADSEILIYLEELDINFMDFAYRWVSCYLTREFDIYQTIRLWDTYFSEDEGFSQFHSYVCAALFLQFSKQIKEMGFQEAMIFLQNLPTREWKDDDLTMLLAKSFEMKELYHYNRHLVNQKIEAQQILDDVNQSAAVDK